MDLMVLLAMLTIVKNFQNDGYASRISQMDSHWSVTVASAMLLGLVDVYYRQWMRITRTLFRVIKQ